MKIEEGRKEAGEETETEWNKRELHDSREQDEAKPVDKESRIVKRE